MYRDDDDDDDDTIQEQRFDISFLILKLWFYSNSFSALDDGERIFVWNEKGKNKSYNLLLIDSSLNVVVLACPFTVGGLHVKIFLKVPADLAAIELKLDVMFGNISIHGRFITAINDTVKCDLF